jgi:bacterioferritin (cytochrome b1)
MNDQLSLSGTRVLPGEPAPRGAAGASAADGEHNAAMAIRLLHEALLIARGVAARCERQYHAGLRHHSPALAAAALEHANEARLQAESLSARVAALGGTPAATAAVSALRVPAEPRDGHSLVALIGGYLVAGHATIESYRRIATLMEPCDRPTQMLLESIVAGEEERASRLAALLEQAAAPAAEIFRQNCRGPAFPRS